MGPRIQLELRAEWIGKRSTSYRVWTNYTDEKEPGSEGLCLPYQGLWGLVVQEQETNKNFEVKSKINFYFCFKSVTLRVDWWQKDMWGGYLNCPSLLTWCLQGERSTFEIEGKHQRVWLLNMENEVEDRIYRKQKQRILEPLYHKMSTLRIIVTKDTSLELSAFKKRCFEVWDQS